MIAARTRDQVHRDGNEMKKLLERKLERMFPDDFTRRRVRKVLENYGSEYHEREPERVRLGILKLAGDSLRSVEEYTGYARQDYRDILAWAECPRRARQWVQPDEETERQLDLEDREEYEHWLND